MATKMVLRKQTGHICTECKSSFKAKELLIEHCETCPASKTIPLRLSESKTRILGHLDATGNSESDVNSSELGVLLTRDTTHTPSTQDYRLQSSSSTIYRSVAVNDNNNSAIYSGNTGVVFSQVNSMDSKSQDVIIKYAVPVPILKHENEISLESIIPKLQEQENNQVTTTLVEIPNVDGFFDDVCAFEVIEEVVTGTSSTSNKIAESMPSQQNKSESLSSPLESSLCSKKLNKKKRQNSSSNSSEPLSTSSSGAVSSSCNNPSVYSLCLAAEIASSMETVQAAKSLLGMSLQQGEVEAEDGSNVKMVSILKKPEMGRAASKDVPQKAEVQAAQGIKRESEEQQVIQVSTPTLNVFSKISFLQSLNNHIMGKETDSTNLSALIKTPVVCDARVKIETENDEGSTSAPPERKVARLNFNIVKPGGTPTSGNLQSRWVMGGSRAQFTSPTVVRQNIYRPQQVITHVTNTPNRPRQTYLPGLTYASQDVSLMPVTNEVEVVTEVIKTEDSKAVEDLLNRQLVFQVPNNQTRAAVVVSTVAESTSATHNTTEVRDGKIFLCGLCGKAFDDCEVLKLHVEKHAGMEKQNSGKSKSTEDRITDDDSGGEEDGEDIRRSDGGQRHKCRECGVKFSRLSLLRKHAKAEHGGLKAFVCGACNKTFPFACSLKLHALTHGAERRYSCQFCGRRFKHASNLQKHVKVVHVNACKCRTVECTCGKRDPSSFKIDHACRICGRVCESSKHLEIHHRSHTGEKPEVCQTCGKSFQHKSNLQKHQLKHTGIRPFKCHVCERSFFVKHSYLGHLRLHTHDSPFTCETCGKSFISKNGLQVHSILHQDNLPFRCGQCGREFAQLGNLNKHLSLHTGDKPFPCNHCDKKFVDTSALKRHMVIHTRERNYACPECGKTFLHFSSLRNHVNTHKNDEQERYQCKTCNKLFTIKSNYIRHMKQHEDVEQVEYLVYMP